MEGESKAYEKTRSLCVQKRTAHSFSAAVKHPCNTQIAPTLVDADWSCVSHKTSVFV